MSDAIQVLVKLMGITAPMPVMHFEAAEKFIQLRNDVITGSGIDFLARCGDILRAPDFVSNKDGVANRSWHKTGRAFDYNQESPNLVIAPEINGGKQFFRTYLKCAVQDGSLGKKLTVKIMSGGKVTAFLFDFTEAAERLGFRRIPAWSGWQKSWNRREFWHYQYDQGKSWDDAMLELKSKARPEFRQVLGLNDRGEDVRLLQSKLADLGFLLAKEVDEVFGAKTKAAVAAFQAKNGLEADGIAGPATKAKLFS